MDSGWPSIEAPRYKANIQMWEEVLASFGRKALEASLTRVFNRGSTKSRQQDGTDPNRSLENPTEDEISSINNLLEMLDVVEEPSRNPETDESPASELLDKWALSTAAYQRFVTWGPESIVSVLWLNGGHGTGKIRLLQAAIKSLLEDGSPSDSDRPKEVAYFFYNSSKPQQRSALSAVKALIRHALEKQPYLSEYLSSKIGTTSQDEFNDSNDFYGRATVLYAFLCDEHFRCIYFIVYSIEALVDKDIDLVSTSAPNSG